MPRNRNFGYRSVSEAASNMRDEGAKRLRDTLGEVAQGSLVCALGAGLAMFAGVLAVPAWLFFFIELFFICACHVFISRAQDMRYTYEQRREWLSMARRMFLGLCFSLGYGLSPMLSVMNVILGPQNILLALLATFLVLAVTSMLALLCFEKKKGKDFIKSFAPLVCWVLLALLLVGAMISFMPHVSAALVVYSALSAVVFSLVLFLDIIKHLYLEDNASFSVHPLSSQAQAQNLRASVGIFLDMLNIFVDLLTLWSAMTASKDGNRQAPEMSAVFKTVIGLVLPMGVIAMLIASACSGSSASASGAPASVALEPGWECEPTASDFAPTASAFAPVAPTASAFASAAFAPVASAAFAPVASAASDNNDIPMGIPVVDAQYVNAAGA